MKISNEYGKARNLTAAKGPVCSSCGAAITGPNKTVPVASRNTLHSFAKTVIQCNPCIRKLRIQLTRP